MPEKIKLIKEGGGIHYWNVGRLMFLFLIGALVLIAAQAVNELVEAIITKWIPKKLCLERWNRSLKKWAFR